MAGHFDRHSRDGAEKTSQLAALETGEPRGIWPYKQWSLSYKPKELPSLSEQQEGVKRTLSSHDKCLKLS